MGLTLVTPPTADPVTLAEAKAHLSVLENDDDTLITALVAAASRHVETMVGLSLTTRTYQLTLDAFSDCMELLRGPVQSVTWVKYVDAAGVTQTVSPSDYVLDLVSARNWVMRDLEATWPTTLNAVNVVTIEYVAGFAAVPARYADLRLAILMLVAHWYANREAVNVGNIVTALPMAVEALMRPYRPVI